MNSPLFERFLKEKNHLFHIANRRYEITVNDATWDDAESVSIEEACLSAGELNIERIPDKERLPSRLCADFERLKLLTPDKLVLLSSEFLEKDHIIARFFRWRLENGV